MDEQTEQIKRIEFLIATDDSDADQIIRRFMYEAGKNGIDYAEAEQVVWSAISKGKSSRWYIKNGYAWVVDGELKWRVDVTPF